MKPPPVKPRGPMPPKRVIRPPQAGMPGSTPPATQPVNMGRVASRYMPMNKGPAPKRGNP